MIYPVDCSNLAFGAIAKQTKSQTNIFLTKNTEVTSPFYMHNFKYLSAVRQVALKSLENYT